MVIAVSVGPVDLSTRDSMTGLLEVVGIGDSSATVIEQLVIGRIRLPRTILAMLVGAAAVEDQDFLLRTLLDDGDRGGDRVARCDGAAEAQRLVQIDGARTG